MSCLTLSEVENAINNLRRERETGPDELIPGDFKNPDPALAVKLTEGLAKIWDNNQYTNAKVWLDCSK